MVQGTGGVDFRNDRTLTDVAESTVVVVDGCAESAGDG